MKPEGRDVDLFLTGSRWSACSRKERRVCRGAYARQGRRQGAWHAWGAAKQAAGRGGRWQAACMAGSGRTGAAQYGACKGLVEQSKQRTQVGEQAAQIRRKKKKEVQEIKWGSGVYIGVVESS